MKKTLITLLIIVCSVSLFAADVSAKVHLYPVFDKDGFRIETAIFSLAYSVSGDQAGAEIKTEYDFTTQQQKRGLYFKGNIWFVPSDPIKITTGFATQFVAGKSLTITPSDTFSYAGMVYNFKDGAEYKLQFGSLIPADFNLKNNKYYYMTKLAFGHFEKDGEDFTKVAHVDARGKISFSNGKLVTHMFRGSAQFIPYGSGTYFTELSDFESTYGGWGDGIGWCDDSDFIKYKYPAGSWNSSKTRYYSIPSKIFKVALTYQYSENYADYDNGLLLDVYLKDIPLQKNKETGKYNMQYKEGSSISVATELSFKKFDLELGYHYNNSKKNLNIAESTKLSLIYNKNGKADFNVPFATAEVLYGGKDYTLFSNLEYIHSKDDRSGNGVFLNVNPYGSIGICSYNYNLRAGFDGKQIKDYKIGADFSVGF